MGRAPRNQQAVGIVLHAKHCAKSSGEPQDLSNHEHCEEDIHDGEAD